VRNKTRLAAAVVGACVVSTLLADPALAISTAHPKSSTFSVLDTLPGEPAADSHAYFISPTGSDTNPGTEAAPFKTLMKGQLAASAGDTVYIRGGIYNQFEIAQTKNPHENVYHYVNDISKSGITYKAYPGDARPIFDFSAVPTDQRVAAFYVGDQVTGVNFIGFDVTGVKVGTQKQSEAFRVAGGANFINMAAHDNEAIGFYYTMNGTGLVLNCDSYNNIGPTTQSAANTDGFGAHAKDVWFINDRAWNNSDDGYDSISSTGRVTYVNDWSFNHHGNQNGVGDKNGFKVGGYAYRTEGLPDPLPLHTVINSLSADNGSNNFYANHQPGQSAVWLNNTGFNPGHGANFNMLERVSPTSSENIPGYREVLHNNVAYSGPLTANENTPEEQETNNSWTIEGGLNVTAGDFESLDMQQLTAPRKQDGSLPDVTFMKPVNGSPLQLHGLGYLADKGNPYATLEKLVTAYSESGDINNQGLRDSLMEKLRDHELKAFIKGLEAQSQGHISAYAVDTLILVAKSI
jgi:hypothetical protein